MHFVHSFGLIDFAFQSNQQIVKSMRNACVRASFYWLHLFARRIVYSILLDMHCCRETRAHRLTHTVKIVCACLQQWRFWAFISKESDNIDDRCVCKNERLRISSVLVDRRVVDAAKSYISFVLLPIECACVSACVSTAFAKVATSAFFLQEKGGKNKLQLR